MKRRKRMTVAFTTHLGGHTTLDDNARERLTALRGQALEACERALASSLSAPADDIERLQLGLEAAGTLMGLWHLQMEPWHHGFMSSQVLSGTPREPGSPMTVGDDWLITGKNEPKVEGNDETSAESRDA